MSTELARARVTAIMDEIARLQGSLGAPVNQPSDREAHDLVAHIERRALSCPPQARQSEAAE